MKIKTFELVNFRGIERMSLDFSSETTALVGVNGVGKSSVLDALVISLSNFRYALKEQRRVARVRGKILP